MAGGGGGESIFVLPPGFRFHPTDEEIITHYLSPKILDHSFSVRAMGEVDLNKCEPWDLPSKAKMGEKELYFYSHKDRKYPTGMRTNRATQAGYWKATGKDKEIYRGKGVLVGMKKTLVFYKGRAPKGEKTNWVMHEFRLEGKASFPNLPKSAKDEWVVCRVIHKNAGPRRSPAQAPAFAEDLIMDSAAALPPLMDPTAAEYSGLMPSSSFVNNIDQSRASFDFKGMPPPPPLMNMELQQTISRQFMVSNPHGYLHPHDPYSGSAKLCKAEQYSSNNSIGGGGYCPSQDTGTSADHNTTEISSVVSTHFGDLDDWTSYGFSEFLEKL